VSERSGTFFMIHVPSDKREAAKIGNEEFFEPLMFILPDNCDVGEII